MLSHQLEISMSGYSHSSTADISHICEFAWFDWVMLRDNIPTFPDHKLILGHYLLPATDVGLALTAKILKSNGQVVYRSTLRHLTDLEHACLVLTADRKSFDNSIAERLGPAAQDTDFLAYVLTPEYELFGDEGDADFDFDLDPDHTDLEVTPEVGNNYIGVDLLFPKGGTMSRGRVTAQKRDADGNPKGRANSNPILDSREYMVTFDDGDVTNLTTNLIAESMYAQCDPDNNQYVLLDSLIGHQHLDTALQLSDQTVVRNDGWTYQKRNTVGWQLCCQWKDGSSSWEKFSDLKELHPLETAEYAVTIGINHKPAFNWWIPHVLRKHDRIISAVAKRSARFLKWTHKFGIEIPRTVKEALELDRQNGNTLWADAIAKEMTEVHKASDILLPDGKTAPVGYQKDPMSYGF
jgi:hypothetical protein